MLPICGAVPGVCVAGGDWAVQALEMIKSADTAFIASIVRRRGLMGWVGIRGERNEHGKNKSLPQKTIDAEFSCGMC